VHAKALFLRSIESMGREFEFVLPFTDNRRFSGAIETRTPTQDFPRGHNSFG
jgi:hypothetical protein